MKKKTRTKLRTKLVDRLVRIDRGWALDDKDVFTRYSSAPANAWCYKVDGTQLDAVMFAIQYFGVSVKWHGCVDNQTYLKYFILKLEKAEKAIREYLDIINGVLPYPTKIFKKTVELNRKCETGSGSIVMYIDPNKEKFGSDWEWGYIRLNACVEGIGFYSESDMKALANILIGIRKAIKDSKEVQDILMGN